jgi:hypothetical protein
MELEIEQCFSVWIDRDTRIVSFQKVEGFEKLTFQTNEEKLAFVVKMGSDGYGIQ